MKAAKPSPLFPRLDVEMDPSGLADNLYAAAHCLEQLLLEGGAVPGKDYTRADLLRVVQPFVLAESQSQRGPMKWFFPETRGD